MTLRATLAESHQAFRRPLLATPSSITSHVLSPHQHRHQTIDTLTHTGAHRFAAMAQFTAEQQELFAFLEEVTEGRVTAKTWQQDRCHRLPESCIHMHACVCLCVCVCVCVCVAMYGSPHAWETGLQDVCA